MKKELQERLSKYTAAAAALTVGAAGVNAQIVYTDIADYSHPGDEVGVGLDMNNDSNFDYILVSADTVTPNGRVRYTVVAPYGSVSSMNAIAGETPSSFDYALALGYNDLIDNTLNWISSTNTMAYNVDSSNPYNENWNGVTDRYLGLQFSFGGSTYYGWARLDVQAIGDAWTLKDYAYNDVTGVGILAGQTNANVGLEDADMESLVHFVNAPNNTVIVRLNESLTEGNITVVSTAGQIVQTGRAENSQFTVDMNGLSSGIYMINVVTEQGAITKKMMVR